MNKLRHKPLKQYKYLTFITMLFVTVMLICDITAFRMVPLFSIEVPLSGFIIPIVFAIGDVIAEAYGYRITMKALKSCIACQFLFGLAMMSILNAPSLGHNIINEHYNYAFEHIFRTSITSCFSVTSGMLANAYLISKLKIYMNGKRFWLRTLISSGISEIVLCTVAYLILFSGLKNFHEVFNIIFVVWIYKMAVSFLINPIVNIVGQMIKKHEQTDVYDKGISYNPLIDNQEYLTEYSGVFNENRKTSSNDLSIKNSEKEPWINKIHKNDSYYFG